MHVKQLLLAFVAATLMVTTADAKQARRGFFTVTQPDGTTLQVQKVGDEFSHHTITDDGKLVIKEGNTYFYKNVSADGVDVNTGVVARPASERTAADLKVIQSINDIDIARIHAERKQLREVSARQSRAIEQSGMGLFTGEFPRKGSIKALVILVEFSDVKFKLSDPKGYFTDMLTKQGFDLYKGTGSAHDFFIQNSKGQFDPQFDLFGPVTLNKPMADYGANNSYGDDVNPHGMIVDACKALNDQINFADYDMDNDGEVDNVYVFYAGWGEASYDDDDCIWPHSWYVYDGGKQYVKLDGKLINRYACSNEWEDWGDRTSYERPDGIGTFVHEFSHVMGLPDLYDTSEAGTAVGTPGEWAVMDYGSYNNYGCTPPAYSSFERNALGWIDPYVIDGASSYDLSNLADTNEACIIPTGKSTEFFLLENRQNTGWDAYLPGHGLLIWHIDFDQNVWDNNEVNNKSSHLYVQLEKANNNTNSKYADGWSFPGTSGKTSFTDTTNPSMKTWGGANLNLPITGISETGGIVSFDVAGGGSRIEAPQLTYSVPSTADSFTLNWQPTEGAVDYLVTVFEYVMTDITQVYDSSNLPTGWSQSFSNYYTSADNFETGTRSLQMKNSGDVLTTCKYTSDVTAISFWHKGQNNNASSYLSVEGLVGNSWQLIKKLVPTKNTALTEKITSVPAGVKQVRFTYTKSSGNLALDNIQITSQGEDVAIYNDIDGVSTAGATSYTVNLGANHGDKYIACVRASDGTRLSPETMVEIDVKNAAGIDAVFTDNDDNAPVEYFNLQGIKVDTPIQGHIYIRRQGTKTSKIRY